jgi:hypothetical protein
MCRQPVHVAMRAGIEKFAEMQPCLRDRIGAGDADAIETECTGFVGEILFQLRGSKPGRLVQKSRST